ncbi:DUF2459 domain-containing protein [Lewinella sp. W8]|uniref:DUF2459 domain-containing protein n=1 Tax=Lewinella sp. W8 TaxID=2528208 RepID=UPI00106883D4|nr:DUF2459 domain-containing protein [Lewinella sp. W8]MTB49778.1 DUF2459 domain-containing protein [Lewinella sp. W8]
MKRLMLFGTLLVVPAVAVLLYAIIGALISLIPGREKASGGPNTRRVYLDGNGLHCEFVFSVNDLPADLAAEFRPTGAYLGIGWGERSFYLDIPTWDDLTAKIAFRAMLMPSPTVMHLRNHQAADANWLPLELTETQFQELLTYTLASFTRTGGGAFRHLPGVGFDERDFFYEARGAYSLFKTCNSWTNGGLKAIGCATAHWTPYDQAIKLHYRRRQRRLTRQLRLA